MPVYLAHGFRWPRDGFTGIRVHAIVHNLEDCSVEYIQNDNSRADILDSFRKAFPDIMKELDSSMTGRRLDFLEQHDPEDELGEYAVSQPYAFVCDRVLMMAGGKDASSHAAKISQLYPGPANDNDRAASAGSRNAQQPSQASKSRTGQSSFGRSTSAPFNSPATCTALSLNLDDVISDGPGMTTQAWEAMADLRDKLAEGQKIGWWVVYNGDPDRGYDEDDDDEDYDSQDDEAGYDEGHTQEDINNHDDNAAQYDGSDYGDQTPSNDASEKILLQTQGNGAGYPPSAHESTTVSANLFAPREELLLPQEPSNEKEVAPKSLAKPLSGAKIGTGRRPPPVAPATSNPLQTTPPRQQQEMLPQKQQLRAATPSPPHTQAATSIIHSKNHIASQIQTASSTQSQGLHSTGQVLVSPVASSITLPIRGSSPLPQRGPSPLPTHESNQYPLQPRHTHQPSQQALQPSQLHPQNKPDPATQRLSGPGPAVLTGEVTPTNTTFPATIGATQYENLPNPSAAAAASAASAARAIPTPAHIQQQLQQQQNYPQQAALRGPSNEKPRENIPEPPKLKEVNKASGLRRKFFGRKA